ncbi:hypothetical protein FACS1894105_11590 [Clostridia bacterium]|nr:hypothetical protein FACS1894105_11590 [Clostridia bacterium]
MNTTEIKIANQRIDRVRIADFRPSNYQRTTDPKQVKNIISKFNETKLGLLTVSYRDNQIFLVDGAHRTLALRELGYTHATCLVLTGLTYDEEAEYFRLQDEDQRGMSPWNKFNAGIEAKNPVYVKINDIVKVNGFTITRSNGNFYNLSSVYALFTIVADFGYDVLDNTLCLLASTWSSISRASKCECLLGTAEFVNRYGMAEFPERMRDVFGAVWYEYTEAMRVHGSINSVTSRKKFCKILVGLYNKRLKPTNKRYLSWEE